MWWKARQDGSSVERMVHRGGAADSGEQSHRARGAEREGVKGSAPTLHSDA